MEGSDKRFVIPVYQRNYDWKIENCKQLYDDLVKIIVENRRSHFFGSIVSKYNQDSNGEHLIIDGQQRLTTVSLLFLAMYNLLDKGILVANAENLKHRIYDEYLVDKYQPKEKRLKLKPVKRDRMAFDKLFCDSSEYIRDSHLTVNYNYFYERIKDHEISIDDLFRAIQRLDVISISLNCEDNAQLIFESLNSTGLELNEGDKIRNFILMGQPAQKQEDYYEKYWNRIERSTGYSVSVFIRDYLSVKQQSIPPQKKVYSIFKDFFRTRNYETEQLLKEMLQYAKRYEILLGKETPCRELNACIKRLIRLETTVARPFFLEVLRLYDDNRLSIEDVTQVFLIAENYVLRRNICDLPTNALNKIFLSLHNEIVRYESNEDNYVEKCKFALLAKKDKARFPDDKEFASAFISKPVYNMYPKNKIYLFERLENSGSAEDKDIYRHCDAGDYSIDHIMPQILTPTWKRELGENHEAIHAKWLHRIGNLTLTAYNSKYGNSSFLNKRTTKNGYDESGIRLNAWISKKERWTLTEIEERSQLLAQQALSIWPMPATSYKPAEKQMIAYTLEDALAVSGCSIIRYAYKNSEQPVTSWVKMYKNVLNLLYDEDRSIIETLAASDNKCGLESNFSFCEDAFNRSEPIGNGIYVWTNNNTQHKLGVLIDLFKLHQIDLSDLVFYLRDEAQE